jgi:hypothetical protein
MTRRALAQLPDVNQITHVFAHGGVGSIASTSPRGAVRHALVGVATDDLRRPRLPGSVAGGVGLDWFSCSHDLTTFANAAGCSIRIMRSEAGIAPTSIRIATTKQLRVVRGS